jgi:redox-sensitive bicupin YhaK (pirin superfamily)
MITLRRARERHHDRRRKQEVWLTFYPRAQADSLAGGFAALEVLNEDRLPPGAGVPRYPYHDAEIVTYVREGALAYADSMGRSGVIHAGEFQHMTAQRGVRHSETNVSRTDWAHVFQIWLRPSQVGLEPSHEQKRFSTADRRGLLCAVASPDARRGSLRTHQDAVLYSTMLDPGQHVVHELSQGRSAWLHLVQGEVALGDVILTTGDGAGVSAERAVSVTARGETEILLLDLGEPPPRPGGHDGQNGQNGHDRHGGAP